MQTRRYHTHSPSGCGFLHHRDSCLVVPSSTPYPSLHCQSSSTAMDINNNHITITHVFSAAASLSPASQSCGRGSASLLERAYKLDCPAVSYFSIVSKAQWLREFPQSTDWFARQVDYQLLKNDRMSSLAAHSTNHFTDIRNYFSLSTSSSSTCCG